MESMQSEPSVEEPSVGRVSLTFDRTSILVATTLVVILVVALSLRLYGINWHEGYGHSPHPDERNISLPHRGPRVSHAR